jgi:DNA-binding transcriptional ArsR family regulator
METRRDVFQAIADPTRRDIISLLSKKALNLNSIADHFEVTRPAISNHIRILSECGIVTIEQIGRERYCKIQPKNLKSVSDWANQFHQLWEERIDSFEQYVYKLRAKRNKDGNARK